MKKKYRKKVIGRVLVKRSKSGLGLFSNRLFKKGDFIIEYTGELIPNSIADEKNSKYLFALDSHWTIDGTGRENISRYINHSCFPNSEAVIDGRKIKIYARRRIVPGEELGYDYGKDYFDEYIKPCGCRCSHCQSKKKTK
jgi:uncharacterized protein